MEAKDRANRASCVVRRVSPTPPLPEFFRPFVFTRKERDTDDSSGRVYAATTT